MFFFISSLCGPDKHRACKTRNSTHELPHECAHENAQMGVHMARGQLSGPIPRDTAILSLRYPISRDTFSGRVALPQNGAIPPLWHLVSHRHICAIPHFATYRAIIVRYPTKTSTKEFCDAIAASIARYGKYRYWASRVARLLDDSSWARPSGPWRRPPQLKHCPPQG